MPHVSFVPFSGFRIREEELLELGMSLPGLKARGAAIAGLPPLGILTVAGMTPPSWTSSLHEARVWDEELADRVAAERPTLVALSALSASIEEAYSFSALLRRKGLKVVIGGPHVTACPEEARAHCESIAVGEGEPLWPQILKDVENEALKPFYKAGSHFDLARAPLPRYELLGRKKRPRLTLQTQRGCPLACDFCASGRLLGPPREKPAQKIKEELEAICAISPNPVIELADDNTFACGRDGRDIFEVLGGANARYFTEADWRIGERPDILSGLAASGCVEVLVGIESLIFAHSGMGQKRADLGRVMEALAAIQESGVAVIGCFIAGCDGETAASLERLARFIETSDLAEVQITIQTPFPGTALRSRLEREGRLLPDRGWSYCTLFDVTYKPDSMSVEDLEREFRTLLSRVFSREEAARRSRIRRSIWKRRRFKP